MSVSIIIKSLGGASGSTEFPVDVPTASTVEELKEQIADRVSLPKDHIRLVCAGHVWENSRTVGSYEVKDGSVVHCLNNPPRNAPQASQTLAPAHPMQTMLGQMPADPMRQLASNPEIIQQMMNNPFVQQMMSSPETLRALVRIHPQLNQLMEERPEIARMLEDPEMVQQSMRMIANPSLMREHVRNSDRAMGRLNVAPGGQDALRRAHEEVVDPLLTALQGDGDNATDGISAGGYTQTTDGAPNADALPNPWGAPAPAPTPGPGVATQHAPAAAGIGAVAPTTTPAAAPGTVPAVPPAWPTPTPGISPGFPGLQQQGAMQGNPMANMMQQMTSNPAMMQMMQQMMSNPAMMQNMFGGGGFGAQNPTAGVPPATTGFPPMGGFPMPTGMPTPAAANPAFAQMQRARYASQLSQLANMGFTDEARCLEALQQHGGRIDAAIDTLLSS
eukprot:TRINITY_DN11129_c0_g1_i1.p1 TRINITY_DN11129_c0_g1~~TRINITY_DN11129_c0_g1_i1.p1  ORF type:complete len:446 (-),score=99.20 TRINITY_DN11129_c0_g1_i1:163-1500(-)